MGLSRGYNVKGPRMAGPQDPTPLWELRSKPAFSPYNDNFEKDFDIKVRDGDIEIRDEKGFHVYTLFKKHIEDRKLTADQLAKLTVEKTQFGVLLLKIGT
uniref:Uncharacterized protein n=1 Tax=Acrobeloides nanus TaxID=290746 RepID=A0A914DMB8_9BILA